MPELALIFEALSKAIADAEKADPTLWQIDDGDGGDGEHIGYRDRFEEQADDEA